jgi:hypothetical protein
MSGDGEDAVAVAREEGYPAIADLLSSAGSR